MTTYRMTARLRAVYEAVQAAGPAGMMFSQIRGAVAELGMTEKSLHSLVHRALVAGLLTQLLPRGPYTARADVELPPLTLIDRALALVADCPGGVSDQLLAEELGLTVNKVQRLMFRMVDSGRVLRTHMPKAHGGGKGYAMPQLAAATGGAMAPLADPQGAFELLDHSRLALAWDGARVVLPAGVTRGLFRYLDALSGLQLEQQLQAPLPQGPACA